MTRSFAIPASGCYVPSTAVAYSLNITVAPDGLLEYLSVWPAGSPQPFVSTLNSWDGSVVANAAIVPAGTNGSVDIFASANTDLVIDINGYYAVPGDLNGNTALGSGALAVNTTVNGAIDCLRRLLEIGVEKGAIYRNPAEKLSL